jgi:hypothetical protein
MFNTGASAGGFLAASFADADVTANITAASASKQIRTMDLMYTERTFTS